jgi:hypothetical protein
MKLIPNAVLIALNKSICLRSINVSKIMEVNNPFIIANNITLVVVHA